MSGRRGRGISSQAGNGRGGSRGTGNNRPGIRKKVGVCHHFQRGSCTYGASCKFSHVLPSTEQHQQTTEYRQDEHFVEFKRLLRGSSIGRGGRDNMYEEAFKLWRIALLVLDGHDSGVQQLLGKDLISDEFKGPQFIHTTLNLNGRVGVSDPDAIDCGQSFLRVITHPSLLDPLSIDSFVCTIYNFFGGHNGNKAITFLLDLCGRPMSSVPSSEIPDFALLMLKALTELLNREPRSRFNENATTLLDNIQALAAQSEDTARTDMVITRIRFLSRLVARETSRLGDTGAEDSTVPDVGFVRSTFPTEMVLPGGRHDNDSVNISEIQILPTYGEIDCDAPECLPSTDFTQPHFLEDPVQRHLDCAFRLLRHDIFGPVKDVLNEILAQDTSAGHKPRVSGDANARVYQGATIQHVYVERDGLEAVVGFQNPPQIRNESVEKRRRWWEESSRLDEGSLIAFVTTQDHEKIVLFLEVTVKNTENEKKDGKKTTLIGRGKVPQIGVKLATLSQATLGFLTKLYGENRVGVLVEFHALIPATFVPVLSNLQVMMREGELAFQRWIVPSNNSNDAANIEIAPPTYARGQQFRFNLGPIMKNGSFSVQGPRDEALSMLEQGTSLDGGQCEALFAALTREYALIQGPPGTGKSYVGVQLVRVLLENKRKANLGPMLIICYTNHALDQFLEHLLAVGISKIIRIGGRSKAKDLEGKNLRVVRMGTGKTRVENQLLGKTYNSLEGAIKFAGSTLKPLHQTRGRPTWEALDAFLLRQNRAIHSQLTPVDEDGFAVVGGDRLVAWLGHRPKHDNAKIERCKELPYITELTRRAETSISSVSQHGRWALAETWLSQARQDQTERLFERLQLADGYRQTINNVHDDLNRRTLLQADVIGLTTTGLARNISMLRRLHPKIVICEEAAEVMEAHIISALMPGVEHFIQIGDHRQLRPQILNYSLSLETQSGMAWQLDRSQFERRAVGEPGMRAAPVAQLDVQRRMRPGISRLIRTVYPNLKDHHTVLNLPDVVGMRHNIYWLNHNHPEASRDDGARVKSHSNDWEVDMTTALVRHLVRQGTYTTSDIALLTPYTGQLRKLRTSLSRDFEIFLGERDREILAFEDADEKGVNTLKEHHKPLEKRQLIQTLRLATVDNFQGEEAKVIVVSLVRSNQSRKVGFLRTENRINVLLSRAQHGMYLIGNADTYLNVDMWADVHAQMSQAGAVGNAIPLSCSRHPETPILCTEPDDFVRKSPEGGCELPCDDRLEPCGHRCRARCHSQAMHEVFLCPLECPRIRSTCQHACPKLCSDSCGPCMVKVSHIELPCGHVKATMRCHETLDLPRVRCTAKTKKVIPACGHVVEVECGKDVIPGLFSCPTPCGKVLGCGHNCPGSCGECGKEQGHMKCPKVCDRPFGVCSHRCSKPCHQGEDCGVCYEACEVQCPHSRCGAACNQPCAPCIENCTWSCKHRGPCAMPCAAPCNRLPCDERCDEVLTCGHRCPSFCGEQCPDRSFCQVCGKLGEERVDFMEMKTYKEVDLDELPVVVLTCGHFHTGESLDLWVGISEVYTMDTKGEYQGLEDITAALAKKVPLCPDCRVPIRQFTTRRYNRVINKAVMDETSKRFLTGGRRSLEELETRLKQIKTSLAAVKGYARMKGRYADVSKLEKDADDLRGKMDTEHQPAKKLHDAIITRQRRGEYLPLAAQMHGLDLSPDPNGSATVSTIDQQMSVKALLIQLRVHEVVLHDKFDQGMRSVPSRKLVDHFFHECADLVPKATGACLPRVTVAAILAYAGAFQRQAHRTRSEIDENETGLSPPWDLDAIRERLENASSLCSALPNSEDLHEAIDSMTRLFSGPRYEEVTPEEIEAIKAAMVSDSVGFSTNSGHWYNCANGHPFAIGECGMPMELARCPECGAPIGGQRHELVQGATRATEME